MKLFSGDDKGRVVFSSLDLDQVKEFFFLFLFMEMCLSLLEDHQGFVSGKRPDSDCSWQFKILHLHGYFPGAILLICMKMCAM